MIVDNNSSVGTIAKPRKRTRGGTNASDDVDFGSFLSDDNSAVEKNNDVIPAININPFLALQEIYDNNEEATRTKQDREYASNLIKGLENIRINILSGKVDEASLHNLTVKLEAEKIKNPDPHLHNLIEEVEVRVAVELAKLGKI